MNDLLVGSLDDMMNSCNKVLTEDQIAYVTFFMLKGVGFLHSKKIVHRFLSIDLVTYFCKQRY